MSTPYEDHLYKRIDELLADNQQQRDELAHWAETVQCLARILGETLGQRDRARDLAVTLEGELAVLRVDG